ncbi:MAG TPA: DUF3108 domain-containing protein [Gemmatimonadales bacterium]|nr:DUF3108 domain-containing protein [Gemmatimonadales bacterium]
MKGALALAAVVALLGLERAAPAPRRQAAPRPQDPVPAPLPFTTGERLEYEVKFGIFRVGRATMQVLGVDTIRGTPAYHVAFVIRGRAAFFYSMTDTLESWFSVADLTSLRFVQNNNENGSRYYHTYEIHADSGYFIQDGKDSLPTTARPLDDASFFYFARTVPLQVGQTYSYDRYFKPDRNPVTLTVLSADSVDTPAGRFAAIAVRPVFKSRGLFAEGGQAVVYLSADSTRIPLVIKSHLSLGSLSLALRSRR